MVKSILKIIIVTVVNMIVLICSILCIVGTLVFAICNCLPIISTLTTFAVGVIIIWVCMHILHWVYTDRTKQPYTGEDNGET